MLWRVACGINSAAPVASVHMPMHCSWDRHTGLCSSQQSELPLCKTYMILQGLVKPGTLKHNWRQHLDRKSTGRLHLWGQTNTRDGRACEPQACCYCKAQTLYRPCWKYHTRSGDSRIFPLHCYSADMYMYVYCICMDMNMHVCICYVYVYMCVNYICMYMCLWIWIHMCIWILIQDNIDNKEI